MHGAGWMQSASPFKALLGAFLFFIPLHVSSARCSHPRRADLCPYAVHMSYRLLSQSISFSCLSFICMSPPRGDCLCNYYRTAIEREHHGGIMAGRPPEKLFFSPPEKLDSGGPSRNHSWTQPSMWRHGQGWAWFANVDNSLKDRRVKSSHPSPLNRPPKEPLLHELII